MATMPITPTALPTPPSRDDPANFPARGDAFLGALPTYQTELNSIGTTNYNNAVEANTSATTATTKAGEASTSATNAASSATTATTKAGEASTSATNAAASATTATTKAGEASTSASNAASSASAASTSASNAATSATNAANSATAAENFATQQLKATSSTSNTPSAGSKSFTIETSRSFVTGMYLSITSTSDTSQRMTGYVTSYNSGTGALVVNVDAFTGAIAKADWVIGVTGVPGSSSGLTGQLVTTNTACVAGVEYLVGASGITLTLPTSWSAGDKIAFTEVIGGLVSYTLDFGSTKLRGATIGSITISANRASTQVMTYFDTTQGLK